jgi:hypothetical protein
MAQPLWRKGCAAALVLAVFGLALTCGVMSFRWVDTPFPGFFVMANRVVTSVSLPHWPVALRNHIYQQAVVAVNSRLAWSTYWKLCWEEYPGATAYELQALTGEGGARKLRRQRERCFRIEAAKGENEKTQGLANRDLLLALQAGQLAYRVRAALNDHRVSAWSSPAAVGEVTRR